ncbi:protein lifeguard 3 [Silurus asotus]|uniref:Protein lifeguard 3 n=1 Tax=Silurus asotus TaxID=30991 RepID=A0AAD5FLJ6_SILAS|nr:protein lifeguard 3 [Silurus asotus]
MFKCKLPPSNEKSQHQRSSSPPPPHTFTTPELTGAKAGAGAGVPPPETFTLNPLNMCSGTPPLNPGDIEDSDPSAIWENKSIWHAFIRKVFLIVVLQLLVTTSIVAAFMFVRPFPGNLISMIAFLLFKLFYHGVDGKRNGVGVILKAEYNKNVVDVKRVSDRKKEVQRVTYKSERRCTQVDYVLCRRCNLNEIGDCKVLAGDSVARQHWMVVCRRVLEVKKRRRVRTERRIRWWTLKEEDCSVRLRKEVRQGPDSQTVKCAVGTTDWFKVEVGLHQGSALSPFLFAVVMDRLAYEVRQESPWTLMSAYDIVICGESREQVEKSLERWSFFKWKTVFLFLVMMVVVCVAITVFSFQTKVDFTSRPGLFCALCIVLLITGITTAIVLSFQYFLLFHTRLMVEKRLYELKPEEYLFGALTLFLITPNICFRG